MVHVKIRNPLTSSLCDLGEVWQESKVRRLKEMVMERWLVPPNCQKLVFGTQVLHDDDKDIVCCAAGSQALVVDMLVCNAWPSTLGLELASCCVGGAGFEVDRRYEPKELVEHEYSTITCSAEDKILMEHVALRKVEGVFKHTTVAKRILLELRLLRHLQHENLLQVKNIFVTGRMDNFSELYVVSELMETDLAAVIKSRQPLSNDHCEFFLYQILRGIKYIHSAEVIFCDMQPWNLLVSSNCDLKIRDFRSAARLGFLDREYVFDTNVFPPWRVWYRAPEVLTHTKELSLAMDIWSIGCIFAEMFTREPVFPGKTTVHQLNLILTLLGTSGVRATGESDVPVNVLSFPGMPEGAAASLTSSMPSPSHLTLLPPQRSFGYAFPDMPPKAQDLLEKMLCWDPDSRISAFEAIRHPYLAPLHDPDDEPTTEPLDSAEFAFERQSVSIPHMREEIFHEVLHYHPELLEKFSSYDISPYRFSGISEPQGSPKADCENELLLKEAPA